MDIMTLGSVLAITAICYVLGLGCKAAENPGHLDSRHHGSMRRRTGCAGNEHHAGLPGVGLYQRCGCGGCLWSGGYGCESGI